VPNLKEKLLHTHDQKIPTPRGNWAAPT